MCDFSNKNKNKNYNINNYARKKSKYEDIYSDSTINRTSWLLKLILAVLLFQNAVAASLAKVVDDRQFNDDSATDEDDVATVDVSLRDLSLPLDAQQHRTVASEAVVTTAANVVDTRRGTVSLSNGVGGVDNSNKIVVDTLAEVDEFTNNAADFDHTAAADVNGISGSVDNDIDDIGNDDNDDMDVDLEFAGYLNDFNLQRETSIPEDILDQKHIEEESDFRKDSSAADSILESQRSTSRNFTTFYNRNKKSNDDNNNSHNNGHGNNNKNYNNDDNYWRKKKKTNNNKKNHYKKFKSSSSEGNDVDNQRHGSEHATENMSSKMVQLSDGSIQTEQRQQQQQQEQQQQQQQQKQQLLNINKNLNERKFNKLSSVDNLNIGNDGDDIDDADADDDFVTFAVNGMTWSGLKNDKKNNDFNILPNEHKKSQNMDDATRNSNGNKAEQTAIGDIDNNFFNEDENARNWQDMATDNDAASVEVADAAAAIESDFPSLATATSIITLSNDRTETPISASTTTSKAAVQHTFVGRKTKRHGIRLQPLHQAYEQSKMSAQQTKDKHSRHHRNNSNRSDNNDDNAQRLHEEQQQQQQQPQLPDSAKTAYLSDYYGIATNDSNQEQDIRNHVSLKATPMNVQSVRKDVENGDTTLSAFEQHKAMRRNNRRTGHKSHKKKYKDYLRYTVIATEPPTAITTSAQASTAQPSAMVTAKMTALNSTAIEAHEKITSSTDTHEAQEQLKQQRQQQRSAKLAAYNKDIEKSQHLPAAAAPIFVVAARRAEGTARPYYEGQLSYYMETKDDDSSATGSAVGSSLMETAAAASLKNTVDVGKVITSETVERNNNWYRRMSPILRNGMTQPEHQQPHNRQQYSQHQHHHHHQQHNQQQHQSHHHHQHHQQHHATHHQQQHQHHNKQHHAYQRRPSARHQVITTTSEQQQQAPLYLRTRYIPPFTENAEDGTEGTAPPLAPLPPPSYRGHKGALQELGHQITQMEEFDRYYRKWPHLARVQYQLNDEDYREAHPGLVFGNDGGNVLKSKPDVLYDDYHLLRANEDDVDAEEALFDDEEAEQDEDANLPPYIKKYNRRNKQLLNLLEGTLPPPTPPTRTPKTSYRNRIYSWSSSVLKPGPVESSAVRIDDDYLKEKRRRYHNRNHNNNNNKWANKNSAQQSQDGETLNTGAEQTMATTAMITKAAAAATKDVHMQEPQHQQEEQQNRIPGDDVDVSSQEFDDWEREIETRMAGSEKMKWQIEKTAGGVAAGGTTLAPSGAIPLAPTTTTTTLKPTIYRLPSYPAFSGSYIGKPRSRSAQFAPSSGSSRRIGPTANRGNGFINTLQSGNAGNYKSMPHLMAGNKFDSELENRRQGSSSSSNTMSSGPSDFSLANYESNNSLAAASIATSSPHGDAVALAGAANGIGGGGGGGGVGAKQLTNSFVYHRVEAAPRFVGAGSTGGRKQRLPFVAITDRRLETSKKSSYPLYEQQQQQRDFEQNRYPMP